MSNQTNLEKYFSANFISESEKYRRAYCKPDKKYTCNRSYFKVRFAIKIKV